MYTVALTRIPENGTQKERGLSLDLGELGLKAPFVPGSLRLSWELSRRLGQVYGSLRAEAALRLTCARCLEDFTAPAHAVCQVLFEPRAPRPAGRGDAKERGERDVELDADEGPDVVRFDGEALPVGEEARQELEMAVPFSPVCRPDCAGLCPRCGNNLNAGPCACA